MAKLGPRAKRIAEREFRESLEREFEGKVREQFKQSGIKNARAAVGWMQRRPVTKAVS